tara:strand:+ start:471 stop:641 length:171 start_codon:yes stop_codon:yes gene_type:complete
MSTAKRLEMLEVKLQHMGMMGQWYQRYDISKNAEECKLIIKELKEQLDEPCDISRK